jgi:4-hydroxy-tetrahydrodipicolinate synthase
MDFRGVLAYPITPLRSGGAVDHAELFSHVAQLCEAGPDGVVVLGTSGSFAYLSREERREVVETSVAAAQGTGVPVAAGISAMTTAEVQRLAWDAENAGADGYVLNALSYIPLTSAEVADQVETLVQSTSLPLCVYNNPTTTGFDLPVELAADLAELETVVAFKDTAADRAAFERRRGYLAERRAHELAHGLSSAQLMLEEACPADAWHSGLIAFFPREFARVFAVANGAEGGADVERLRTALAGLNKAVMRARPISGLHALARETGVATAPPRRPLAPVGREDVEALASAVSMVRWAADL